jgi:hypothetical protein
MDIVTTLEKEFCFGRSLSAPVPIIEVDASLNPNPRAVVSLNPMPLTHPDEPKHEVFATMHV